MKKCTSKISTKDVISLSYVEGKSLAQENERNSSNYHLKMRQIY